MQLPAQIAQSKNAYDSLAILGDYHAALNLAEKALSQLSQWPDSLLSHFIVVSDVGNLYFALEDYPVAIRFFEQALALLEITQEQPDKNILAKVHNDLAFSYDMVGYANKAIFSFKRALELWKNEGEVYMGDMLTGYNNVIYAQIDYGDAKGAAATLAELEEYTSNFIARFAPDPQKLVRLEVNLLFNQMRLYSYLENVPEVERLMHTLDLVASKYPASLLEDYYANFLASCEMAGYMSKQLGQYTTAQMYYDKMKGFPLNDFFQMKYHANKAIAYFDAKDYASALPFVNKALAFFETNSFGLGHQTLNILKAHLLYHLGNTAEALTLVTTVFSSLLHKELALDYLPYLQYQDFVALNSPRHIELLLKTAQLFSEKNRKSNSDNDFACALQFYLLAAEMFREYYLQGPYNRQLEQMQKQIEAGFLSLLPKGQNLDLTPFAAYFSLLENNSSQQLWKEFVNKNGQYLGPQGDLSNEKNLLLYQLSVLNQQQESDTRFLKSKIDSIGVLLNKHAPAYTHFQATDFKMSHLQTLLGDHQVVLRYFITQQEVYALQITRNESRLFALGAVVHIQRLAEDFTKVIAKIDDAALELGYELYEQLLAPLSLATGTKLTIVADNFLASIPFEALVTNKGFLVENHVVGYALSLKLLSYQASVVGQRKQENLLIVAPDYKHTNFVPIKNNLKEATAIAQSSNGFALLGNQASKLQFAQNASRYRNIHLAMHAEQDAFNFENSALVFANGEKLFLHELYNYHIPADLVVLSACNTGIGALAPGEGQVSLSRALRYAGVKGTVCSLWQIPDRETAELMTGFYHFLQKDIPADEALAKAKRAFLHQNPFKRHPYFWAGFVLSGKVVTTDSNFSLLWWALLPLTLFGILILAFRMQKAKR